VVLAASPDTLVVVAILEIAFADDLAVIDVKHAETGAFMRTERLRHTLYIRELFQGDGFGATLVVLRRALFLDVAFFVQDKLFCQPGILRAFELGQPNPLGYFNHY
jgi:hypothetical protein